MADRLAKVIRVVTTPETADKLSENYIEIDGEPFPYFTVAGVGYTVVVRRGELGSVTLTIAAERVEVEHQSIPPMSEAKSETVGSHA